jgi:hypothetical protein
MSATYTKEIRKSLGYCATWLPNATLRLGDVGVLTDHIYRRVGAAKDFDLRFTAREGPGRSVVDHMSTDSVQLSIVAAAQGPFAQTAPTKARGSLEISFARADAVMFQAGPTTIHEMEDVNAVGIQILDLYRRGEWQDDYVLITELVEAARTTVLIASGKEAKVVLTADAGVELGQTSLIDSKIGLQLESARNIGTRIVSESGLTPLFRAFAVRKPPLRPGRFGPIRAVREPSFQDVDYDDFA